MVQKRDVDDLRMKDPYERVPLRLERIRACVERAVHELGHIQSDAQWLKSRGFHDYLDRLDKALIEATVAGMHAHHNCNPDVILSDDNFIPGRNGATNG